MVFLCWFSCLRCMPLLFWRGFQLVIPFGIFLSKYGKSVVVAMHSCFPSLVACFEVNMLQSVALWLVACIAYHSADDWPGSFLQVLVVDLTVSIPLSCCCCLSSLMTCCVMEGNFIHSLLLLVQLSIYLSCHLLSHLQGCIVEHECCSSFLFIDLIVSSHWQLLFPWRIACIFCHLTLSVCWSCL